MKAGIMQAYFFPYIGYFQLINAVDTFVIYEHVTFRKRTWITKNCILDKGKNEPVYINVPVIGKSSNKLINEICISDDPKWKIKLLKLIYFNYKKASFFDEIYSVIEECLNINESSLHNFNARILITLCDFLEIKTPIFFKNQSFLSLEEKLVKTVSNPMEIKSKRIVEICKKLNATTYVNPIGGTELYDKNYFKGYDISLNFIKTDHFKYSQFGKEHVPYLSIIDVLMHNGKEGTQELIKNATPAKNNA